MTLRYDELSEEIRAALDKLDTTQIKELRCPQCGEELTPCRVCHVREEGPNGEVLRWMVCDTCCPGVSGGGHYDGGGVPVHWFPTPNMVRVWGRLLDGTDISYQSADVKVPQKARVT